jgi:protein-tyrosine-phosphatase
MTNSIHNIIESSIKNGFTKISEKRKLVLEKIASYISLKIENNMPIRLIYICTHNSRRSHFGQIWAQVAANYFGISNFSSYSGGTEVTAFNINAIKALQTIGFEVNIQYNDASNPIYEVLYSKDYDPIICFSKVYDHESNPKNEFAAIMTCSSADEACPTVFGADARFATPYEDPKKFDGTEIETKMYLERCFEIATEVFYTFSKVSKKSF